MALLKPYSLIFLYFCILCNVLAQRELGGGYYGERRRPAGKQLGDEYEIAERQAECSAETEPECREVCDSYAPMDINTAFCFTNRLPSGAKRVYWIISDLVTWSEARSECLVAGGDLAVFATMHDRIIAGTIMPQYVTGRSNGNQRIQTAFDYESMMWGHSWNAITGFWVGLRKKSSDADWQWVDGTKVTHRLPIPWNCCITSGPDNKDLLQNGRIRCGEEVVNNNCAVIAQSGEIDSVRWTSSGYWRGLCDTKVRAICMKTVQ